MALTYREALARLGRRVVVQMDKRRGTEIRRAPGEAGDAGDIQVRYRGTPVVTFHPDGTYTLRTGGLATRTVRNRIAEYSPVSLVHRGGSYFIEDVNSGRLLPFLEGTRIDQRGNVLDIDGGSEMAMPASGEAGDMGAAAGGGAVVDEAKLRAYVKRLVDDALRERGVLAPMRPGTEGAPVRMVKLRARAREMKPDEPVISLPVLERLLLDSGVPQEKVRKTLRDMRESLYRGRDKGDTAEDHATAFETGEAEEDAPRAPAYVEHHTAPAKIGKLGDCDRCGLNIVAHYDNANRLRGCEYAAKHRENVTLV